MKTFTQFMAETEKKKSAVHVDGDGFGVALALFGSHSIKNKVVPKPDKDGFYPAFAGFGSHSTSKKKKLKEERQLNLPFKKEVPSNTNRVSDFSPWSHDISQSYGTKPHDEHMAKNVLPLHKTLSEHYKDYDEHLLHHGIHSYTRDSSSQNRGLISHHIHNTNVDEDHHDMIHALDKGFERHKTPHDMTVYSGSSHSPEHYPIDEKTGKRHMVFPAYTSTSINARAASGFAQTDYKMKDAQYPGRHVMKFHVPQGHPGMYLENHTKITGEHEMLLHRGMKAHVNAEPETVKHKDGYGGETVTHIWHAHVLPHDGNQKPVGKEHHNVTDADHELLKQLGHDPHKPAPPPNAKKPEPPHQNHDVDAIYKMLKGKNKDED